MLRACDGIGTESALKSAGGALPSGRSLEGLLPQHMLRCVAATVFMMSACSSGDVVDPLEPSETVDERADETSQRADGAPSENERSSGDEEIDEAYLVINEVCPSPVDGPDWFELFVAHYGIADFCTGYCNKDCRNSLKQNWDFYTARFRLKNLS